MASLGELFYEAGVKTTGLDSLSELERRLNALPEQKRVTLDVSGVNLLKQLTSDAIESSEAVQRVGTVAMDVKRALTDVFSKGNIYSGATRELDRLTKKQSDFVGQFNALAGTSTQEGFETQMRAIYQSFDKYISRYSVLGESMKTILGEAFDTGAISKRQYTTWSDLTMKINEVVASLKFFRSETERAMSSGNSWDKDKNSIISAYDNIFQKFSNTTYADGFKAAIVDMGKMEEKFLSSIYNMGKNATPAMKEAADNFRKELNRSFGGISIKDLEIQRVYIKEFIPSGGSVRRLRDRIQQELASLDRILVRVEYGDMKESRGSRRNSSVQSELGLTDKQKYDDYKRANPQYKSIFAELESGINKDVASYADLLALAKHEISIAKNGLQEELDKPLTARKDQLITEQSSLKQTISDQTSVIEAQKKQMEDLLALAKEKGIALQQERATNDIAKTTSAIDQQTSALDRSEKKVIELTNKFADISATLTAFNTRNDAKALFNGVFGKDGLKTTVNDEALNRAIDGVTERARIGKEAIQQMLAAEPNDAVRRELQELDKAITMAEKDWISFVARVKNGEFSGNLTGLASQTPNEANKVVLALEKAKKMYDAYDIKNESWQNAFNGVSQKAAETSAAVAQVGDASDLVKRKIQLMQEALTKTFSDNMVKNIEKLDKNLAIILDDKKSKGVKKTAETNASNILKDSLSDISKTKTEFENLAASKENSPFAKELRNIADAAMNAEKAINAAMAAIKNNDSEALRKISGGMSQEINKILGMAQRYRDIMASEVIASTGVIGVKGKGTSTSDEIKALLSAGESVLTAKATEKLSSYLNLFNALGEGTHNIEAVGNALKSLYRITLNTPNNGIFATAIENLAREKKLLESDIMAITKLLNQDANAALVSLKAFGKNVDPLFLRAVPASDRAYDNSGAKSDLTALMRQADTLERQLISLEDRMRSLGKSPANSGEISRLKSEYETIFRKLIDVNDALSPALARNSMLNAHMESAKQLRQELVLLEKSFEKLKASGGVYEKDGSLSSEAMSMLLKRDYILDELKQKTMSLAEVSKAAASEQIAADKAAAQAQQEAIKADEARIAARKRLEAEQSKAISGRVAEYAASIGRPNDGLVQLGDYFRQAEKDAKKLDDQCIQLERNLSKLKGKNIDGIGGTGAEGISKSIQSYERLIAYIRNLLQAGNTEKISRLLTMLPKTASLLSTKASQSIDAYNNSVKAATGSVLQHNSALGDTFKQIFSLESQFSMLSSTIQNTFSILGLQQFAKEIINIGGEIEKQKLAMGSILGGNDRSEKIYKKISSLSMISPFDVEEIMKYSKQLSAFGIQYDDLYDTTKRLADIAAGVGVDFGRIAYEYGQTSSRGWLDARELRMFANSGIPLLQKLSEHYSKLRDEMVSTSMVREMITKREVSFDDVKKVLWDMTDEGGTFFQMQEVMAESLAAKYRNLGNAWNLMLAELAQNSGEGAILKSLAESLTWMTEQWRLIVPAIEGFVTALVLAKTVQGASTLALRAENAELAKGVVFNNELTNAEKVRFVAKSRLNAAQRDAVVASSNLTAAMLREMLVTGQLTEKEAILAIKNGVLGKSFDRLSKEQKQSYLIQAGFGKLFAKAASGASIFSRSLLGLKLVAKSIKAVFMSFLPMLALTAAFSAISLLISKLKEIGKLNRELRKIESETNLERDKSVNSLKHYLDLLNRSNLSLEERKRIIGKMKTEYSDYLGELDLESMSWWEISKAVNSATESIRKNLEEKKKTKQIEAVYDEYVPKIDKAKETVKESAMNAFNDNPALARSIYGEAIRLVDEGVSAEDIFKKFKEQFGISGDKLSDALSGLGDYVKYTKKMNDKIAEIELGGYNVSEAQKLVKEIQDYYDTANKGEESYEKRLLNRKKAVETIIDILVSPKDKKITLFEGTLQKDVFGFGEIYDENSEYVKAFKDQLAEIDKNLSASWRSIADTTARGAKDLYVNGKKISNASIVAALTPNEKITETEFYKSLAKMYKELSGTGEGSVKYLEERKKAAEGLFSDNGFPLWGDEQEKKLVKARETLRLLLEDEKNLAINFADFESGAENKRTKEIINNIQNLKKAYDEYKKFVEMYGHKEGLEKWTNTDRYKREFSDVNINDIMKFREALERAYNEAAADPKLKEAASKISDIIIQFDMDFSNKSVEQSISKLKDKLNDDIKRFDFFDKLVAAGFSNEQAYKIALDGIEKGIADSVASGIRQGARQSLSSVVQAFKISNTDTKTEKVEVAKFVPKKNKDFVLMMYPLVTAELKKRSYVKPEEVDEYARIIISQLADESGWGRSLLSSGYNNFGGHKPGIKPVKHVIGKVWMDNKQKNDGSWYNVYDSIEGFLEDHIDYVNRKFNAFEKGVDMYMKQLQENPRYQDPNTGKQKQVYATVDLKKGKGTYEKYVRAIMKHVNKALQEGGVAEFDDKTFTKVLKDKANLAVSDNEIDEIFTMSEDQIRERYGKYADNIIDIIHNMSSELEARTKGVRFNNVGEYLKTSIESAFGKADINIGDLRYLDAAGLQSYAQENGLNNLSKVQAQTLKGYVDEYLKFQDKISSSAKDKFVEALKETQSYLDKRQAIENEYAKTLSDIDYLIGKETDAQARKTLELQKQVVEMKKIRDLAKVDYEQWQKTPEVRFALENLSNVPVKVLDGLGDALKTYLSDAIATGDQGTARDVAGKMFDVLDVEAVRQPLKYLDQSLVDQAKAAYNAAKVNENLAKKERDRIIASNASASEKAAAEEMVIQANAKVAASEETLYRAMNLREKAMQAFIESMDKFGNSLKELGNSIGGGVGSVLGYAGESLGLFGDMKENFSSFAKASKDGVSLWKGGAWINTVSAISGMAAGYANLLNKISDAVSNVQYDMYERAAQKQREINAMVDAVHAYKKAVIEARHEEENWFGGATSHKSIRDASEGLKATADKYDAIMEEKTEKYVNKSGKGWGAYLAAGLVAVAGVVAAIYTGGSSLMAAGGAVGAILAGVTGTVTAAAVGAAAIITASAAAGSLIAAGVDAAIQASKFNSEKISAYKNLVIETREVSKGFWGTGWGGHDQQTMDLQKWLDQVGQISKAYAKLKKGQMSESEYDAYVKRTAQSKHSAEMQKKFAEELYRAGIDNTNLFDEWGMINIELANAILENETLSGKLMGDTKETMEKLVETAEEWKEYTDQIKEAVSNMFSPLIDNMVDAVWDWFDNGADALDSFRNKASDTFREIASDMLRTMMQKQVFQKYADQLNNLFIAWGAESIDDNTLTTQMAAISGAMLGEVEKLMPMWEKWLELTDQAIKSVGFENGLTSSSNTSTASNGIKSITEETADIIAAYINGMRLDLSVQRSVVEKIYELMLAKSGMKLEDGEYVPFEELESSALPVPQEMLESIKEPMLYNNILMETIALEQLPTFNAIAESQLAQLNMITENTRIGAEYAQICAGYAEEMRDLFRDVTTGIKKVSVE